MVIATKRLGDSPPHAALTDTEDAYEPTEGDAAVNQSIISSSSSNAIFGHYSNRYVNTLSIV